MHFIKLKLRSQSGASITFALLLFLVCAVLSSVIIVAATASAGRMSRIAEKDQRYYSVSYASELLKDVMETPKTVSIVKIITSSYTTPYNDDIPGERSNGPTSYETYIVPDKTKEQLAGMGKSKIISLPGAQKIDGTNFNGTVQFAAIQNEAAYQYYNNHTIPMLPGDNPRILSLTSDIRKTAEPDVDPIKIVVEERMDEDGNITLIVGDGVERELLYECELKKDSKPRPDPDSPGDGPKQNYKSWEDEYNSDVIHSRYTITTTKIEKEIQSLTWKLKQ